MKPSVAVTLGAGVVAALFGAYLVSYATTVRDPVEFKNGDLVVQDARVGNVSPVFAADGSGFTHIGIVEVTDNGTMVIEAADKVVVTPMREFLKRGGDKTFAAFRIPSLTDAQGASVVAAALRQLGKPNDYFLNKSWDALYSSELVRLAYSDIGIDLGRLRKFNKIASDPSELKAQVMRNWSANSDCARRHMDSEQCWTMIAKQDVITPSSIVADARVTKIYESEKPSGGFTLSRNNEKKDEQGEAAAP